MKTLRIICTVICALALAAIFPVGTFLGLPYVLGLVLLGGVSFLLMLIFKNRQEAAEEKRNPTPPQGDFLHPISRDDNDQTREN